MRPILLGGCCLLAAVLGHAAEPDSDAIQPQSTASVVAGGKVRMSAAKLEQLRAGRAQDVIIEVASRDADVATVTMRAERRLPWSSRAVLDFRRERYRALAAGVLDRLRRSDYQRLREYSQLPLVGVRLRTAAALDALRNDPQVLAIHEVRPLRAVLDSASSNLIALPAIAGFGVTGAGTTVAVIDSGVNYTTADFACTAPGVPATCKVNYYDNLADASTVLDASNHGTNVSGIVVGVAPGTKIAALNVFGAGDTTNDLLVLSAMDWAIEEQATYNIVAINMSIGDSANYGAGCPGSAYVMPVINAQQAGIETFVAAGNDRFNTGVSSPGCAPGVTTVGAVYSANIGAASFAACADATTAPDKVTCFSNLPPVGSSLSYDFLLAPGANVVGGGFAGSGTSQATPIAAGTRALIASKIPDSPPSSLSRPSTYYGAAVAGVPKSITRTGYSATLPRLDVYSSLHAVNDDFAASLPYAGGIVGNNVVANKQASEPNHAGNVGGRSVWFTWTPVASGPMVIETHGSTFDTLLAVYTGNSVAALTAVAANDNDGSANGNSQLALSAQAGAQYRIAVDGKNGANGVYGVFVHPPNDDFSLATVITGSGSTAVSNEFASAEVGEKLHAGATPSASLWWRWTAPASGQAVFDTHGSSADTVLDVEQGSSVSGTTVLASNDNDGASGGASGVALTVQSGSQYLIAVDSKSAFGAIQFRWSIQSSPMADLAVGITGSAVTAPGPVSYNVTTSNVGPAAATAPSLTVTLPAGVTYQSVVVQGGPQTTCNRSGQVVTCSLGTLLPGVVSTIVVQGTVAAAGNYPASAVVSSSISDPSTANNSATATTLSQDPVMADAPTLPQWAAMLLGALLLASIAGAKEESGHGR